MEYHDNPSASTEESDTVMDKQQRGESRRDFEARNTRLRNARQEEAAQHQVRARRLTVAYERGRRQCLGLCESIHAALPPEVRDLIYDHLVRPGVEYHVMEARDEKGNLRTSNNPLVSMSFFDPRSRIPAEPRVRRDIWRYSEYTGSVVGKEIAERWYRTSTFVVYAEDDLFDKFLTTDVWERGVIPANVVRHLRLILGSRILHDDSGDHQVIRNITDLPRITNLKAHISIEVSIGIRHYNYGVSTLKDLAPVVNHLLEAGYRNVRVYDRRYPPGEQDLTHLFSRARTSA